MNDTLPNGTELSPEKMLLDHIRRFDRTRKGRSAVHLHLSQLKDHFRQPHHLRIAQRAFDFLINGTESRLYPLNNGDFVLISKDVPVGDMDAALSKVRILFNGDPLIDDDESFATWYDMGTQYNEFLQDMETVVEASQKASAKPAQLHPSAAKSMAGRPLTPESLDRAIAVLRNTDIFDLIKHQAAIRIGAGGDAKLLFREHFVSIGALQTRIAPGTALVADQWLFQYFTEELDKRMLVAMGQRELSGMKHPISINLNLATVFSREFEAFNNAVGPDARKIVIEFQTRDVFSSLSRYAMARKLLQNKGYKVLIDALNPLSLQFFDPGRLEPDYFKVYWGEEYVTGASQKRIDEMHAMVAKLGASNVLMARLDSEDAIKFGLNLGITQFQGHFTDDLLRAMAAKMGRKAP